jgi:hypothetical protein
LLIPAAVAGVQRNCPVNPTKVVVGEVKGQGRFQVLPLLREGVGQPGKPSNHHSHGQVLALNVRCAHAFLIRLTDDGFPNRLDNARGRVAAARYQLRKPVNRFSKMEIIFS